MTTAEWERAGDGCTCWVNPKPFTYYGAVEPGDALVPDNDCPEHFSKEVVAMRKEGGRDGEG